MRAALVAICLRPILPPVDFCAVCFVLVNHSSLLHPLASSTASLPTCSLPRRSFLPLASTRIIHRLSPHLFFATPTCHTPCHLHLVFCRLSPHVFFTMPPLSRSVPRPPAFNRICPTLHPNLRRHPTPHQFSLPRSPRMWRARRKSFDIIVTRLACVEENCLDFSLKSRGQGLGWARDTQRQ